MSVKKRVKDISLESGSLLKTLIYTLSFISLCAALILFVLLPLLRDYEGNIEVANLQNSLLDNARATLAASEAKLNKLRTDYNKSLGQMEEPIHSESLQRLLSSHISHLHLKQIPITKPKTYLKYEFAVSGSVRTPAGFYRFLDALSAFDNLIEIAYPLTLKSSPDGIDLSFTMRIYSAL